MVSRGPFFFRKDLNKDMCTVSLGSQGAQQNSIYSYWTRNYQVVNEAVYLFDRPTFEVYQIIAS